jgi:hypothetical protein
MTSYPPTPRRLRFVHRRVFCFIDLPLLQIATIVAICSNVSSCLPRVFNLAILKTNLKRPGDAPKIKNQPQRLVFDLIRVIFLIRPD